MGRFHARGMGVARVGVGGKGVVHADRVNNSPASRTAGGILEPAGPDLAAPHASRAPPPISRLTPRRYSHADNAIPLRPVERGDAVHSGCGPH